MSKIKEKEQSEQNTKDNTSDISDLSDHSFDSGKLDVSKSTFGQLFSSTSSCSEDVNPDSPAATLPGQHESAAAALAPELACQTSVPGTPENTHATTPAAANVMDSLDSICEMVGESLRLEITSVVSNLKAFLSNELQKSESRVSAQVSGLKSEVATLTSALEVSNFKVANLEVSVEDLKATIRNTTPAPANPAVPALPAYDTVIAGDSIVKHINADVLEGTNKLICLPGARCFKVRRAVSAFAKTASIKNLVLHLGTNHIPQQSPKGVATEIANTLKHVQIELPNTKIFFSAILPKYDASFNPAINFINSCIRGLCRENDFGYIPHGDFCSYDIFNEKLFSPSEWYRGEPLHPSHDGVRTLTRDIRQAVDAQASPG